MIFESGMTVTVLRPPASDEVGDRGEPTSHEVAGCALAQKSTDTDRDRRQTAVATQRLLCPADADIRDGDKVVFDSVTYQVEGLPKVVTSPFDGWTPGMVVSLKGVK